MKCSICGTTESGIYIRDGLYGVPICDICEWTIFVDSCATPTKSKKETKIMAELQYPFASKEAQYAEYDDSTLQYALRDARDTLARAEDMRREGYEFHGRKGPGWRSDDVATICREIGKRETDRAKALGMRMVEFPK